MRARSRRESCAAWIESPGSILPAPRCCCCYCGFSLSLSLFPFSPVSLRPFPARRFTCKLVEVLRTTRIYIHVTHIYTHTDARRGGLISRPSLLQFAIRRPDALYTHIKIKCLDCAAHLVPDFSATVLTRYIYTHGEGRERRARMANLFGSLSARELPLDFAQISSLFGIVTLSLLERAWAMYIEKTLYGRRRRCPGLF